MSFEERLDALEFALIEWVLTPTRDDLWLALMERLDDPSFQTRPNPLAKLQQLRIADFDEYETHLDRRQAETDAALALVDAEAARHDAALAERDATIAEAARLLGYALHLRQYGERAPGGDETWAEWDQQAESYVRALDGGEPARSESTEQHE